MQEILALGREGGFSFEKGQLIFKAIDLSVIFLQSHFSIGAGVEGFG